MAEILELRKNMWSAVSSRKHTFTCYASSETSNTYMVAGNVKYGFKDGKEGETDWVAKAEFEGKDDKRKMRFYQVFLVSTKLNTRRADITHIFAKLGVYRTQGRSD